MKTDIIIAGVGGQGILSIAAGIGLAAVEAGLFLKQSEVHGMSQRGGEVQSHLRISDKKETISSYVIGPLYFTTPSPPDVLSIFSQID